MRLKQFTAPTMSEALEKVRAALGSEAVILTRRKVKGQVQITAAVEEESDVSLQPSQKKRVSAPKTQKTDRWQLDDFLAAHGVEPKAIERLSKAVTALVENDFSPTEALDMVLGKRVTFISPAEMLIRGKAHVFVGPTGAGKTTLISKLAHHYKNSGDAIGLLSLDDEKIGGFEPLNIVAEILGEQAHLITEKDDLKKAAKHLGKRHFLLVDTPGVSPYQPEAIMALKNRIDGLGLDPVVHLVLPASFNAEELPALPVAYHPFQATRATFTKLDETARMGGILNTILESGLQVCYVTNQPQVHHMPTVLDAASLAQALLTSPPSLLETPA